LVFMCRINTFMGDGAPEELRQLLDDMYQAESRRIHATLIRLLGDFDLAEDALHDAFAAALDQRLPPGRNAGHPARNLIDCCGHDVMLLCMRTTIDMPDNLFRRAKAVMAKRGVTFRALVIDALEQSLDEKNATFALRDASAGYAVKSRDAVSTGDINRAINDLREPKGRS